jgi:hypothetical protein
MGLPCTIFDGECMERKRRRRGNSPAAWKEGRSEEEIDTAAPAAGGAPAALRCGGAARVGWSGGEVREMQEVVPHLYRVGGKRNGRRWWRGSSAGRPLMAAAGGSVEGGYGEGKGPRRWSGWRRRHLWLSGGGGGTRGGRGRRDGRWPVEEEEGEGDAGG